MLLRNYLLSISMLLFISTTSQTIVNGKLKDGVSQKPILLANIGIPNRIIGTLSNDSGEFKIVIPDSLKEEKLKISVIGYESKEIKISEFSSYKEVFLNPAPVKLNEVTIVSSKKLKVKTLGNYTQTKLMLGGFSSNQLGAEIAVKIECHKKKMRLNKFAFHIVMNKFEKALFRFNVYTVGKDGMPDKNILPENIIIETSITNGTVEVDLKPFYITVDEDYFIALEWIKDLGDVKGLFFSTKLIGHGTYFRQASQANWEKIKPLGIGLYVEVEY